MPDNRTPIEKALDRIESSVQLARTREPGESPQRSGAAISLYREGMITRVQLTGFLERLGYSGEQARRLTLSADLDQRRELVGLEADIVYQELRRGRLHPSLAQARLIEAGYTPEIAARRAWLLVLRADAQDLLDQAPGAAP